MTMVRWAQFLIYPVIVGIVYFIFAPYASLKLNSADASTYLNIAENIAHHKGFVVSYDLYQVFTAHYHPLWPYMHPVYPLLCALVFMAHGGIQQVIQLNILILGMNAALIYYIIQTFVPSRLNIFFLASLVLSLNFFHSALFPWTEQVHLLFFLLSFIIFVRFPNHPGGLAAAGALNGFLFLVRVSHVYSILAYLLVLALTGGGFQARLKNILIFIAGMAAVLAPYQWVNWSVYHSFYPQYLKPAADYTLARVSTMATYKYGHLGMYNPLGFRSSLTGTGYFFKHVAGLSQCFYLSLIPIIAYFGRAFAARHSEAEGRFFVLNCLCQSACIVLGYSYSLYWFPMLETLRYALIPFILMAMAGWYCFYELFYASGTRVRKYFAVTILTILAFSLVTRYLDIHRQFMGHPRSGIPYYINLYGSLDWIDKNLPKDALVAADDGQEAYFMHRPFISMPPGESYNCNNLNLFDRIHAPDYYLLSGLVSDKCFSQMAYTKIFSNRMFRILKIKRE